MDFDDEHSIKFSDGLIKQSFVDDLFPVGKRFLIGESLCKAGYLPHPRRRVSVQSSSVGTHIAQRRACMYGARHRLLSG